MFKSHVNANPDSLAIHQGQRKWFAMLLLSKMILLVIAGCGKGAPAPTAPKSEPAQAAPAASTPDVTKAPRSQTAQPIAAKEPKWDLNSADVLETNNLPMAIEWIKTFDEEWLFRTSEENEVTPAAAMKAPWKYYGKPVSFAGVVTIVQSYPPGSDIGRLFGSEVTELVIYTADDVIIDYFVMGDAADLDVDDEVEVYGLVVGQVEVVNSLGGVVVQLVVVGNDVRLFE